MRLRPLVLVVIIALGLLTAPPTGMATSHAPTITLIYVGAWDCVYCKQWESFSLPAWEKSPERRHVDFRIVKATTFWRLDDDRYWPEDIRWVRDKLKITKGTPRFIVVVGHDVRLQRFGLYSWDTNVYPSLKQLVSERTAQ